MIRKRKSRHAVRRDVVIEPPPFIYVSNHGERPVYLRWAKVGNSNQSEEGMNEEQQLRMEIVRLLLTELDYTDDIDGTNGAYVPILLADATKIYAFVRDAAAV